MNDNRVTQEQIDALLDGAETEEHTFWGKELVVSYRLPTRGGFTVSGRAPCVDPANFDLEIGQPEWKPETMPPLPDDPQWLDRMRDGTTEPPPSTPE
jgi:hypothetical protein